MDGGKGTAVDLKLSGNKLRIDMSGVDKTTIKGEIDIDAMTFNFNGIHGEATFKSNETSSGYEHEIKLVWKTPKEI
jgi:hypothetical protein